MEIHWNMTAAEGLDLPVAEREADLVEKSLGGDRHAFSALVRLHQHRVFRLAGRFFRQHEDLEDAAQETFLTAWQKLPTYRQEAPFEHWLTRVCLNTCYQRLRSTQVLDPLPEGELPGQVSAADPDAGMEIERLMKRIGPEDRFILLLLDGEGWSVAEIAERLGWTRVNVKVRAHRARKRLRKILEQG